MESKRRERDLSPDEAAALWLAAIVLAMAPVRKYTIGKLNLSRTRWTIVGGICQHIQVLCWRLRGKEAIRGKAIGYFTAEIGIHDCINQTWTCTSVLSSLRQLHTDN